MMKPTLRLALSLLMLLFLSASLPVSARSWKEIKNSGKLKVLTLDVDLIRERTLQRIVMPIDLERATLRKFSQANGLRLEYVICSSFAELFSKLEAGQGDVISSNVARTPAREKKYLLSKPFAVTREIIFTSSENRWRGNSLSMLSGKTGCILPNTTYEENFRAVSGRMANIRYKRTPRTMTHDELIDNVVQGIYDYSILNEVDLDAWLSYQNGIRKLLILKKNVQLVFAAHKNAVTLIDKLNQHIISPEIIPEKENVLSGKMNEMRMMPDLPTIKKRGFIRMLTSNSIFTCFLQRGEVCGFEYELAKRFAESLDVTVITVIPVNFNDLTRMLEEGKGDFIAANFTKTPERVKAHPTLQFCAPYNEVVQTLVGRPNDKIRKLPDMNGRKIYVRKGNSYHDTLRNLQKDGLRFQIVAIPEDEHPLQTLQKVAKGTYDLTVIDNTYLEIAISGGCKVRKLLALTIPQPCTWVVRKNNPKLAAAINAFFKTENRSTFFNLCKKRYFSPQSAKNVVPYILKNKKLVISPYDDLFKKYGRRYNFTWYLIAAQSYQESRFQADRVNYIGATGLMQVMPKTAAELGITNLTVPENGVRAGCEYLYRIRKRMPEKMTDFNKLCFSLAAYNAGYGHVLDAQKLAVKKGWNPLVWFGQTEKALALLETKEYASQAKFGYCRASETIPYVRNIIKQMMDYEKLLKAAGQQRK